MGRQLGPPCPAQKRRWLPIVCGVKSKCQAWNSSAGTIGPRPAYRTLSLAATSCPATPSSSPPEPQTPHLPGTPACPVPQPTLALLLTTLPKLNLLPGSAQRPPLPGRPTDPSTHLDLTPALAVIFVFPYLKLCFVSACLPCLIRLISMIARPSVRWIWIHIWPPLLPSSEKLEEREPQTVK